MLCSPGSLLRAVTGTAREVPAPGGKGSNHLGLHCKQILYLISCREPSLRGLFADWVFSIAAERISQGCKAALVETTEITLGQDLSWKVANYDVNPC